MSGSGAHSDVKKFGPVDILLMFQGILGWAKQSSDYQVF